MTRGVLIHECVIDTPLFLCYNQVNLGEINHDRRGSYMEAIHSLLNSFVNNPGMIVFMGTTSMAGRVLTIAAGILVCFLGLKLLRLWNVLWGIMLGAGLGFAVSWIFTTDAKTILIVTCGVALLMAALSGALLKFGAFLLCMAGISGVAFQILNPQNWVMLAICGGIGLLAAITAMIWFRPLVIIITALFGGYTAGGTIAVLTGFDDPVIALVISGLVALLGIAVQFAMESRKINKREVIRVNAIKEETSKETEVEQARNILFLDDESDKDDEN